MAVRGAETANKLPTMLTNVDIQNMSEAERAQLLAEFDARLEAHHQQMQRENAALEEKSSVWKLWPTNKQTRENRR
ncbi:MAG TPA: hypothetical protein VF627_15115 [Abditibacterium sp.]